MQSGELRGRITPSWFPASIDAAAPQDSEPARLPACAGTAALEAALAPSSHPAHSAPSTPRVLVTRGPGYVPELFEAGLMASRCSEGTLYSIEPVIAVHLEDVEQHCRLRDPRIVLVDIGLVRRAGPEVLRHVRRRLPATDWLLASDCAATEQIELPILRQTRGLIDWTDNQYRVTCALDAVSFGKLWFPRAVMDSLYRSMLDADDPEHSAEASTSSVAGALSSREAEVFALVRHGMTNRQIAERLGISANTVKKHVANVLEKRGLHGRRQAVE